MKPGSIVICINDIFLERKHLPILPVRNRLYTIREVIPCLEVRNGSPGVTLEEIYGEPVTFESYTGMIVTIEKHFKIERFREVVPPMDLKVLSEILCPEEELVPA